MAFDAEWFDGFDKYGPTGYNPTMADFAGEWTSLTTTNATYAIVAAGVGTGQALSLASTTNVGNTRLNKTLGANYARFIGGATVTWTPSGTGSLSGIILGDGVTDQTSICINNSGLVEVRRGITTVLATTGSGFTSGVPKCIEWDITLHGSAGIAKIWLDGVLTSINTTGLNTISTANAYANVLTLFAVTTVGSITQTTIFDHLYLQMFLASGGSETPWLDNPIVEGQAANLDSSVQFTFGAGVVGQTWRLSTQGNNTPGANVLRLRPAILPANGTLTSITIVPNFTSLTAKFKANVFSSGVAGGTLLKDGVEVVGCTSGVPLVLPLVSTLAPTGGTTYWLGFITDTSGSLLTTDSSTPCVGAANTYASGNPSTLPAMTTAIAAIQIYGNLSASSVNWQLESINPAPGDLSYVFSSTVGQEDLFGFPALVTTPTAIHSTKIAVKMERTDAGARTVDLRTKSASTDVASSPAGQVPAASWSWLTAFQRTDPNTGLAWGASGLNSAQGGYKIAS